MSNTGRKGITFREAGATQGAGYIAVVTWGGKRRYKRFQVSTHGGKRKAFAAALAWRNVQETQLEKPRTDRKVRRIKGRRVGVSRYQPAGGGRPVWEARITVPDGRVKRARFSVDRWGEAGAKGKALARRQEWERKFFGGQLQK